MIGRAGRRFRGGPSLQLVLVTVALAAGALAARGLTASATGASCPLASAVACENALPGSPRSEWDVDGSGDATIQGFATDMSVNRGEPIGFKVKTDAAAYRIDIYRLGWYAGDGARKVATLAPSVALPQVQPACVADAPTGLVDCGNWELSATWHVPTDAVSGVYLARPVRADTGGASHILFVVRDDEGGSDLLFQTADTTWQAYNRYGGNSLYYGAPAGRAYKVSYNRPVTTRAHNSTSYFFNGEYPVLRWLERNGYDVSYFSGVDTDRRGGELREHRVFLSAGHDEYWSADQRANVEAARDAGVSLGFFSGNEVFWKTRWEPSIDGSGKAHRTLVSYKETAAGRKIDPDPAWTGTWRDARFSPPSDGGRPENALTGTLFTVNAYREDPLVVPAEDGKMRFWRGTSVATLAAGESATFPAGVLGHEWDEDVDNGSRPPGLFHVSTTTIAVETHLADEGTRYVPGTATHHLSLYRAASGALVFGAGTVQWGWGLDDVHDVFSGRPPLPPDSRLQQATVNLLADMGVQPASLQSELALATRSTDTAPPTSEITSPTGAASIPSGTTVTVTGTASDEGGRVAAVEVSTDGGATWHPASGRPAWTYTWQVGGYGSVTLRTRAVDDSGNLETPGAGTTVRVGCPCSLWSAANLPATPSVTDRASVELGVRFMPQVDGYVTGLRFYRGPENEGPHVGSLWTGDGTLLARAEFPSAAAAGWQETTLDAPVALQAGQTFVVSYHAPRGGYSVDLFGLRNGRTNAPLVAAADAAGAPNGVFRYGDLPAFPTETYASTNYWVDVVFDTSSPPDTSPPEVLATSPFHGAAAVDPGADVVASFSEPLASESVGPATFELRTLAGATVAATVRYDVATRTARLEPDGDLPSASTFVALVRGGSTGVRDLAGNHLEADHAWSFTTAAASVCPCTLWPATVRPTIETSSDGSAVELGVRFVSDVPGWVTGVRFYKGAGNAGTHVGSLWTATGELLARATFTGETASGWQQVAFGAPVAIAAETVYVASYHAPAGGYSVDTSGLASPQRRGPLTAPADGTGGRNGVFVYGALPSFPTEAWASSNYWVDVVFESEAPPDSTAPEVFAVSPADGASDVPAAGGVSATFSEPLDPGSVTPDSFQLVDAAGAPVAAAVTYDAATRLARLLPSAPLASGVRYTATVTTAVTDVAGNALAAPRTWSFTVRAACPCGLFGDGAAPSIGSSYDAAPVELGVRFRADVSGWVTGLRFFKGPRNGGTHVGSLWSADGTLLARATFTDESAEGWQHVRFSGPVGVAAGNTYVASYHAPRGGYALTTGFFTTEHVSSPLRGLAGDNGVFRYASAPAFPVESYASSNYWVDVVFDTERPADVTPPEVAETVPAADATDAPVDGPVTVRFSEDVAPATVNGSTFELRDAAGTAVAASVSYDAATATARLVPAEVLARGSRYTVLLRGGPGGILDVAGNALVSDEVWTFTTRSCPCSLFSMVMQPAIAASVDAASVELGVKFRSAEAGAVSAIRFYKGPGNDGPHVVSLWTAGGLLLARASVDAGATTGWQEVPLPTPIPVAADAVYVASYFAPRGRYSLTPNGLASDVTSPPLFAPGDGAAAGNGVYGYASDPTFPTNSYGASNYWVDVVFVPSAESSPNG